MLQRNNPSKERSAIIFTASELAEYDYCPLVWWYEKYDPLVAEGSEELFARLVEMEHDHGRAAPALPEYQVIEQLLVRRGAFEAQGQQRAARSEQDEGAAEMEAEGSVSGGNDSGRKLHMLSRLALASLLIALLILALAFLSMFLVI